MVENEKPIVICILCGCEKKYKSKNPYPCPERYTHEWRIKRKKKGWGFPIRSKKAHYFNDDAVSLCGKWMYTGNLEDDNHKSPDNCSICMKKRELLN